MTRAARPRERERGRERWFAASRLLHVASFVGVAAIAAGVALFQFLRAEPGNIDDGFILMVYVRHLAHHGAIAWNLGDPPVDGCTSMLDLLVKSAAVLLTQRDALWCTFNVTALFHALVPLVAMASVLRLDAGTPGRRLLAAAAGALILASMDAGAYAAAFLLETPLYLCSGLGLAGLVVTTRNLTLARIALLIVAAWLVVLARPEGLAPATFLLGAALWIGRGGQPPRRLLGALGIYLAGVALYELWHLRHFGAWAPNAYYAKTSASRMHEIRDGVRYVVAFLSSAAGWAQLGPVLLAPLAALGAAWSTPRARAHYALLSLTAIGLLAVAIYAGGDGYPNGRLLAPAIAFGVLAMAFALVHAQGRLRTAFLAAACAVIVAHGVTMMTAGAPEWGSHVNATAPEFRACEGAVAHALQRVVPEGTVAQTDFQRLKYWSEPLRVRDLEGLNDREIAHQPVEGPVKLGKFRPATVLRSRPEVWIPGHQFRTHKSRVATPNPLLADAATQMRVLGYDEPAKAAEGEVATALAALYVPASVEACGLTYNLFVRKDLAAKFAAAGFSVEGF